MNKMLPLFAGVALLAGVSAANAGGPIQLTTAQLDKVTAGGGEGYNDGKAGNYANDHTGYYDNDHKDYSKFPGIYQNLYEKELKFIIGVLGKQLTGGEYKPCNTDHY